MKKLLAIVVLGLFLITPSWADDISEFQIEGMSIGDNALDYFSKNQIEEDKVNYYKDNEFSVSLLSISNNIYDKVEIHYKINEQKFILYGISGIIFYKKKNSRLQKTTKQN